MKLLVAGGFDEQNKELLKNQQEFAKLLGREIVLQGHVLLNACLTSFDAAIAESAYHTAKSEGKDPNEQIVCYVLPGQELAHEFGNILQSQLENWELGGSRLRIPEPIELADAIILVGGFQGTNRAANWARIAKKPLLPVTRFGGTAEQVYSEEYDHFDRYRGRISRADYENLTQLKSPLDAFVKRVVSLAQMARASRAVFVIMSFDSEDPDLASALEDVLGTYKAVCDEFDYICERVDDESNVPRILPEIIEKISGCAFAIVDLSDERSNVYYELGYAEGQNKPVIVTAKKGTELPFDVKDIPVIFWDNQTNLKKMLSKKLKDLQATHGVMQ
jgi:predicted Rossmann-fold nucleotide-binding protein